jgi:hypothetical protein
MDEESELKITLIACSWMKKLDQEITDTILIDENIELTRTLIGAHR